MIKFEKISKYYGDHLALENFDCEVQPGKSYSLLGNNGSGKSTALKIAAGLYHPSSGNLFIDGEHFWKSETESKKHIGYQPEQVEYPDLITLYECAEFAASIRNTANGSQQNSHDIHMELEKMFQHFNVPDPKKIYFREGSLGMRKKTALVAALSAHPKLIILDEPTNGLDILTQDLLHQILKEKLNEGASLLFSAHHLDWTESLHPTSYFLKGGKTVSVLNSTEVKSQYKTLKDAFRTLCF